MAIAATPAQLPTSPPKRVAIAPPARTTVDRMDMRWRFPIGLGKRVSGYDTAVNLPVGWVRGRVF